MAELLQIKKGWHDGGGDNRKRINQWIDGQIYRSSAVAAAADKEKEIEYQIRTTKAKLEAFGIVTENLMIQ